MQPIRHVRRDAALDAEDQILLAGAFEVAESELGGHSLQLDHRSAAESGGIHAVGFWGRWGGRAARRRSKFLRFGSPVRASRSAAGGEVASLKGRMREAGFEPTTSASGGQRSIQLSYSREPCKLVRTRRTG